MYSLKMALIAFMLTVFFGTSARAQDRAIDGLLIGTAVGGAVGYVIGNEMDRDEYGRRDVYHPRVIYSAPPPPPRYYSDRPYGRSHYRHGYRSAEVCRDTIVVRERYGRYRETVRTVRGDRDDWHRPHYRDSYRHGRYGYRDRW